MCVLLMTQTGVSARMNVRARVLRSCVRACGLMAQACTSRSIRCTRLSTRKRTQATLKDTPADPLALPFSHRAS